MLQLTQWKSYVRSKWAQVQINQVDTEFPGQLKVGMQVTLRTEVSLGELAPEDTRVELYTGCLNAQHVFSQTTVHPLELQ